MLAALWPANANEAAKWESTSAGGWFMAIGGRRTFVPVSDHLTVLEFIPPSTAKKKRKVAQPDDFEILKAKAAALDVKNRRNQGELKQELKPDSARYKRCAYCENPLKFRDSHIDHITSVSKVGVGTLKNTVLVCYKCNPTKKATTLRRFCADGGIHYDIVIARLKMVGKEV